MAYRKKAWTLFDERFIKFLIMNEKEKAKKIIKLNHEAFDRALYSDGALAAAKWLINKRVGLYSMRDLLNFK